MLKTCVTCQNLKPTAEFYPHPFTADKLLAKCKECHKASVSQRRLERLDYYREYDRLRSNLPHRIEARAQYAKTVNGIEKSNAAKLRWTIKNSNRKAASQMVNNALKSGRIKKSPCEVCGSTYRIHGHHEDYSKPLEVRWLCPKHHREVHKL